MTLTPIPAFDYDLSFPQSEDLFPATEIVHSLLEEIETIVSSSRHCLRVSYTLIERARNLYNGINQRILRVETTGDWDEYDAYTKAIDPLEQILLEAIPAIYDDAIHLTVPISPEELIKSTEKWLINKHTIYECCRRLGAEPEFQGLATSPQDSEAEILEARAEDHRDLFNEILLEILDEVPHCTQSNLQVLLKYVIGNLQNAWHVCEQDPLRVINEEWGSISIKCAMVTRGMLLNPTQSPTMAILPHDFRSDNMVWKRVLEMVSLVKMSLSPESIDNTTFGLQQQPSLKVVPPLPRPPRFEFTQRPPTERGRLEGTQPHDLSRPMFQCLREPFPDPHTSTHTQRLSRYRTYNPATIQSSPSVFSVPTPPTAARTPALRWLPGLRVALAFRSSASLPPISDRALRAVASTQDQKAGGKIKEEELQEKLDEAILELVDYWEKLSSLNDDDFDPKTLILNAREKDEKRKRTIISVDELKKVQPSWQRIAQLC
ncbi:hypothetical protein FRC11_006262 [Ceratobasidium sp. 423]|nr:hypothetical protein FRC11_006262 [Ceratobasidium sp. 423]